MTSKLFAHVTQLLCLPRSTRFVCSSMSIALALPLLVTGCESDGPAPDCYYRDGNDECLPANENPERVESGDDGPQSTTQTSTQTSTTGDDVS